MRLLWVWCLLVSVLSARATDVMLPDTARCKAAAMNMERLPDLPVPLTYHHTLCVDGEPLVVGGHTDGFIPVHEAYCLQDGKWTAIPMVYAHDYGLALPLSSGKVLVAGGFEKDFGIGQSYAAELYEPATHSFKSVSILDTRRAMANAIEADSGRVVVSGNWYHTDGIETYDGQQFFSNVKATSQQRANPFVFRTSPRDVLIVGRHESHGADYDTITVDYLNGEPASPPLLQQWRPVPMHLPFRSRDCFIGDEAAGRYDYLMPVSNDAGQVAIMTVSNGEFSLLATDSEIPMRDDDWRRHFAEVGVTVDTAYHWDGRLHWGSPIVADRQRRRAYLVGEGIEMGDSLRLLYVLQIDYATVPARLTLRYALRPDDVGVNIPALTPDGDLLMVGGSRYGNFHLTTSAVLLLVGDHKTAPASRAWLWLIPLLLLVAGAVVYFMRHRRSPDIEPVIDEPAGNDATPLAEPVANDELMQRIAALVNDRQLYLKTDLKASEVAGELGVSARAVTDCIKASRECSFSQFVNACRVECACRLLRRDPDSKISSVWMDSGFSSESSFFRIFKAATGMAPKEWIDHAR